MQCGHYLEQLFDSFCFVDAFNVLFITWTNVDAIATNLLTKYLVTEKSIVEFTRLLKNLAKPSIDLTLNNQLKGYGEETKNRAKA